MIKEPEPRRLYGVGDYLESDKDYVLNNLEWCVEALDQYFEDNTEEAVEERISKFYYRKGNPLHG